MSAIHTEKAFEEAIEFDLIERRGYSKGAHFHKDLALDDQTLLTFLRESQPQAWAQLQAIHKDEMERKLLYRITQEIDLHGMLHALRQGITDYGVRFRLAYFKPESGLNPDTQRLYDLNRLTVMRQVHYSNQHQNSLDMLLCLNGLPVATAELKNRFTGQSAANAKKQYIEDRDPNELLFRFNRRALVHFAVDDEEVYFTTRLAGKKTRYFPFNLGNGAAAGNPPNPGGYKTAYLWERIWAKESMLDLIGRFLHLQVEEYELEGKKRKKETLIFPRFHQMDAVRQLTKAARRQGPGKNYLIQHSAGSGKSNSIAWLAYRLASLHNERDERVFDSVVVITDRRVLDNQLQDTIYQFEHKLGVVQKIDKDSNQLAEALSAGTSIIITTLQKFPFVLEKVENLPERNYAVIVDEAHSSQGGEAAKKMKEVLSNKNPQDFGNLEGFEGDEEEETPEDVIRKSLEARGQQPNLSFFAFTATPKPKTLEVFGEKDSDGKPKPFHLYSMRQAIEEGFIHDVLKNYTTYKTYFRLSKAIEEDPQLNKKKAARAIGRFLSLHPHNLAQKTEVMAEHYRQVVSTRIGGKAKAMLVSGSRLHAVKYYHEFKRYLGEKGYTHIRPLVAFSGTVTDELGNEYSESGLNGFSERELPEQFATDKYQVLIVADKYQTGFDQPLLHTMYVDKKLSGVKAVQTLSRLNRICPGKENTFVLDFANSEDEILNSFQPYYELTKLEETTDPNHLYNLKTNMEQKQVFTPPEIDAFCSIYFKPKNLLSKTDQAKLYAHVQPAVDRYINLPSEEEREDFKNTLTAFTRLYAFLSQIMPFQDIELEKLFTYGKFLLNKLPRKSISERLKLDDEVALDYYRLQKISEKHLVLEKQGEYGIKGTTEAGIRKEKEEFEKLSKIIDILNDKLGTDFTEADQLFFDQMEEELIEQETLVKQAKVNTIDNFKHGFEDAFMEVLINRMDKNKALFNKIMDDETIAAIVKEMLMKNVYRRANL